jgi:Flp pilus assembly protein TadD
VKTTYARQFGFQPDQAQALYDVGFELLDSHQLVEAKTLFEGLRVINPLDATAVASLGAIADLEGDTANAELLYTKAIEIDPECEHALLARGKARLTKGDRSGLKDLEALAQMQSRAASQARALLRAQKN